MAPPTRMSAKDRVNMGRVVKRGEIKTQKFGHGNKVALKEPCLGVRVPNRYKGTNLFQRFKQHVGSRKTGQNDAKNVPTSASKKSARSIQRKWAVGLPAIPSSPKDDSIEFNPDPTDSNSETDFSGFPDSDHEDQDKTSLEGLTVPNYFISDIEAEGYIIAPCKVLSKAGDEITNFFNTKVESAHEDDALRGVAALIYWVRHQLSEADNRFLIAPARHLTKSPLYQLHRARVLKWQASFQSKVMDFYKSGVYATCEELSNFFEDATQVQRHKLWSDIYDQAPLAMAKASLIGLTGSVPVDEIYSWDGSEHYKWRQYIKTTFIFAADDTYVYRYKTGDKTKSLCFDRWLAMPNHPAFAPLNLGDIEELPVKAGGLWDQGRGRKAKKQTYTAYERLADV